jgi:predicted amidophosphoribosyltransferase
VFTKTEPAPSGPASRTIARALAGFVFPSRCLACATEPVRAFFRGGVCEPCWAALPRDASRCDTCDESLPALDASRCGRCLLDPPPYSRLFAAAPYRASARGILLAFKFRGADYLAPRLADVMIERLALPPDLDEIAAVPATPRASRRAPHAADLLAAALARRLGRPFARGRIAKRRETERQSGLPLERRAENVRGAFRASRPAPARVLLVDDVATSGATARECTRALLAAGASEVAVACFARASRHDIALEPAP